MKLALRPSIWLKMATFVGTLVVLTSGVLIWTAYLFARDMLLAQIHERLTVTASDCQAMLLAYIRQQHARVGLVSSQTRLRQLLKDHATGEISGAALHVGVRPVLLDAQRSAGDFLAICLTDLAGKIITASDETYLGQDLSTDPSFVYGQHIAYLGLPRLTGGRYHAFLSGPAMAPGGTTLGVIIVVLDLDAMWQLIARHYPWCCAIL
jgi:C4-dicarboxylate-specific signal transduction histidine kinase